MKKTIYQVKSTISAINKSKNKCSITDYEVMEDNSIGYLVQNPFMDSQDNSNILIEKSKINNLDSIISENTLSEINAYIWIDNPDLFRDVKVGLELVLLKIIEKRIDEIKYLQLGYKESTKRHNSYLQKY